MQLSIMMIEFNQIIKYHDLILEIKFKNVDIQWFNMGTGVAYIEKKSLSYLSYCLKYSLSKT
jgi:hypothetical protein